MSGSHGENNSGDGYPSAFLVAVVVAVGWPILMTLDAFRWLVRRARESLQ